MIKINNLKKTFEEKTLFSKFNLTIKNNEFVIFSGVSGCGKTTLLNMIGGLEPFDDGSILVNNIDISIRKNKPKYFSEVVGFLFQNFILVEDKTVFQNLNIIRPINRSEVSFEEALEKVGLKDKLNSKVYTLSGGEQQRVALARLIIKKCSLILADEPTGSLDRKNADGVMDILQKLNDDGKTVIIVTHDELIRSRGNRVVQL